MARILVVGGLGWDMPLWLDKPFESGARIGLRGLSHEANQIVGAGRLGGGAANCAACLACAGHNVWVVGRVGNDDNGRRVLSELKRRRIHTPLVSRDDMPTIFALVLIEPDGERTILGMAASTVKPLMSTNLDLSTVSMLSALEPFDAVILRATCQKIGVRPPLIVAHLPHAFPYETIADVTVAGADDLPELARHSPIKHARKTIASVQWAIVTNGSKMLVAESATERLEHYPDFSPVHDATGAGDAFLAGITDALINGATMPEALAHASAWGNRAVALEGSAPEPGEVGFDSFSRLQERF